MQVLFTCELSELKPVMQMSFGDWELFRTLVIMLREKEASFAHLEEDDVSSGGSNAQPEADDTQSDVDGKPESGAHDDLSSAKNRETTHVAKETDEPAKPYDRLVVEHSDDVVDGSDDDYVTSRVNTPESSHYEDTDDEERQQEMNELEIAAPETDAKDNAPEKDDDSGFLDVCVLRSHYGGYVKEEENDSKGKTCSYFL